MIAFRHVISSNIDIFQLMIGVCSVERWNKWSIFLLGAWRRPRRLRLLRAMGCTAKPGRRPRARRRRSCGARMVWLAAARTAWRRGFASFRQRGPVWDASSRPRGLDLGLVDLVVVSPPLSKPPSSLLGGGWRHGGPAHPHRRIKVPVRWSLSCEVGD
jgi:hypothetical protein